MSKKRIAIVYGGFQSEREVSERSMQGLLTMMDSERYDLVPVEITRTAWTAHVGNEEFAIDRRDFSYVRECRKCRFDLAYITIHGAPGENGQLTAYLEMIGQKHSTCPSLVAAMTYDKWVCNSYLRGAGFYVANSTLIRPGQTVATEDIVRRLGLPLFVKPAAAGSSFGITKVKRIEELLPAIDVARKESRNVVVEAFLPGREITCGLYRHQKQVKCLPLTEVQTDNEFFDYDAKYSGKTREITPAHLDYDLNERIVRVAQDVYNHLGMRGIVRIDFIVSDHIPFILEVNTTPGQTTTSFIPQEIRAAGKEPAEVFNEVIEEALSEEIA